MTCISCLKRTRPVSSNKIHIIINMKRPYSRSTGVSLYKSHEDVSVMPEDYPVCRSKSQHTLTVYASQLYQSEPAVQSRAGSASSLKSVMPALNVQLVFLCAPRTRQLTPMQVRSKSAVIIFTPVTDLSIYVSPCGILYSAFRLFLCCDYMIPWFRTVFNIQYRRNM